MSLVFLNDLALSFFCNYLKSAAFNKTTNILINTLNLPGIQPIMRRYQRRLRHIRELQHRLDELEKSEPAWKNHPSALRNKQMIKVKKHHHHQVNTPPQAFLKIKNRYINEKINAAFRFLKYQCLEIEILQSSNMSDFYHLVAVKKYLYL